MFSLVRGRERRIPYQARVRLSAALSHCSMLASHDQDSPARAGGQLASEVRGARGRLQNIRQSSISELTTAVGSGASWSQTPPAHWRRAANRRDGRLMVGSKPTAT